MKKAKKWIAIIICIALIAAAVAIVVIYGQKWATETNTYDVNDAFSSIHISADAVDVKILPSENGTCKVVCVENKKVHHKISVEDNVLTIGDGEEKNLVEKVYRMISKQVITIYLPIAEYNDLIIENSTGNVDVAKVGKFSMVDISLSTGDVDFSTNVVGLTKIEATTGDVSVKNVELGSLIAEVTTGNIELSNVNCEASLTADVTTGDAELENILCENLYSDGKTGELSMENVIAKGKFEIDRDTGDVEIERCDAQELYITTDTGDVEGSLLSDKVFIVSTDTGNVNVPQTTTGGVCKITTDTGNIRITIVK